MLKEEGRERGMHAGIVSGERERERAEGKERKESEILRLCGERKGEEGREKEIKEGVVKG